MDRGEWRELALSAWRIARHPWQHSFTRFAIFGSVGLIFDISLLWLLATVTPLPPPVTVTIAFATSYLVNFTLNRRFSFDAQAEPAIAQLARFAPQLGIDYVLTLVSFEALSWLGLPLIPARVLAAGTNGLFNYFAYRWWTFRPGITDQVSGPDRLSADDSAANPDRRSVA